MIRTLRKKFIAIAMLSVALVLAGILAVIDVANYMDVRETIETRMSLLVAAESVGQLRGFGDIGVQGLIGNAESDSSGVTDSQPQQPGNQPPQGTFGRGRGGGPFGDDGKNDIFNEVRFDARYFSVICDSDGEIISMDTSQTASVSEERARELVSEAYGTRGGYAERFYYMAMETAADGTALPDGELRYIFLDSSRELATFYSYLRYSIVIGLIGLAVFFVLIFFSSRIVLRPVEESYAKQRRFITDASHELKTPLGIIGANAEVIELESGETEWTKSIKNQISRLTSLTEKLVFLSRMDEEGSRLEMSDVDISQLVSETAEAYEAMAETRGLTLTSDIAPDIHIHGDGQNLIQMLSLLMDNAMKYTNDGGSVEVALTPYNKGKQTARLTVTNTVVEIKKGSHDEMFERFYRADTSRNSKTGGHGIGLSVVYAIVQAHGGRITAQSPDGKSLRIAITL